MSIERRLVGKIPLSQRQAFEIFIWERGLKRSKISLSQRQAFETFIWERGLKRSKIPLSQRQAFEIFIWARGLKRSKIPLDVGTRRIRRSLGAGIKKIEDSPLTETSV